VNNPARANQSGFGKVSRLKRLSASKSQLSRSSSPRIKIHASDSHASAEIDCSRPLTGRQLPESADAYPSVAFLDAKTRVIEGAPAPALGERSGAPSGSRPSSFVMCNTPVEVQLPQPGVSIVRAAPQS
jgi:hypothetical protein